MLQKKAQMKSQRKNEKEKLAREKLSIPPLFID
jgi:hypothetical protein